MGTISNTSSDSLVLIISLLPFKEAARTCLLSKRWHNLWRRAELNVEFNERLHVVAAEPAQREIQKQDFINSVRRYIARANNEQINVSKFHLVLTLSQDSRVIADEGIDFSVQRSVKHLAIDFSDAAWNEDRFEIDEWAAEENEAARTYVLPESFYLMNLVLESLTLISCNFNIPRLANFHLLKKISLAWIEFPDTNLHKLLVNCVVLESLSLKNCWDLDRLDVCGNDLKLQSLVVDRCWYRVLDEFRIEAPNLTYFKYAGFCAPLFEVKNTGRVKVLDIDFGLEEDCRPELGDSLNDFLHKLCSISTLTVCTYTLQVISMGKDPVGVQNPLGVTSLTLKTEMHGFEILGIKFFLCSCPLLEILDIVIRPGRIFYDKYRPPQYALRNPAMVWAVVDQCITQTLRRVRVMGFKGTPNEMNVLKYLIQNGLVMQNLRLIISREVDDDGSPDTYDLRAQDLLTVRRASPDLQIAIMDNGDYLKNTLRSMVVDHRYIWRREGVANDNGMLSAIVSSNCAVAACVECTVSGVGAGYAMGTANSRCCWWCIH
ncbi:F-box protein At3g62230-like [Pyrus x bretschneideri]|uniref:F-box protein At3g62230-like n=1 Tax=Pyrus x bretschneideri TaxID=225117 RepID=UPI002030636E|nr:F-box protein At3g62230-like [Pyrus x bretschneideri]